MRKPSRAKAVKDKCLECSGGSPLEVTLCVVVQCPLWRFRTGNDTSQAYWQRLARVLRNHPETVEIWKENGLEESILAEISRKIRGISKKRD